jgi:hypothetical protein
MSERKAQLARLRRKIAVGIRQIERGEAIPGEFVFRRLRAKQAKLLGRKVSRTGRPRSRTAVS